MDAPIKTFYPAVGFQFVVIFLGSAGIMLMSKMMIFGSTFLTLFSLVGILILAGCIIGVIYMLVLPAGLIHLTRTGIYSKELKSRKVREIKWEDIQQADLIEQGRFGSFVLFSLKSGEQVELNLGTTFGHNRKLYRQMQNYYQTWTKNKFEDLSLLPSYSPPRMEPIDKFKLVLPLALLTLFLAIILPQESFTICRGGRCGEMDGLIALAVKASIAGEVGYLALLLRHYYSSSENDGIYRAIGATLLLFTSVFAFIAFMLVIA